MDFQKTGKQHAKQIKAMAANAKKWRAENPNKKAIILFKHPEQTLIIASITRGLKAGYVIANAEGLELIRAMWPQNCQNEATVLMVRIALDL